MLSKDLPRPQKLFRVEVIEDSAQDFAFYFEGSLKDTDIGPKSVKEVVLLANISDRHGFTEQNIHLLQRIVKGVLITAGDNANLEEKKWFRNAFTNTGNGYLYGDKIWKATTEPTFT